MPYSFPGEIKAACHQILAGVPSSDSLMGGISGHNQGRQTRNGWGSRCKTEASGPDGHHSPMTHGAPRGNGAVQRQEWCQEPPCGVSLARCGGECGCSGEAKGGLQEGAGCRQNGGSEGGWDNMEEKGGAKSSRGMGASEHGRANSYASGGFSRSAQMESAFPMEASGSRTPILRWTYNPAQALPDLSESSERVDSGLPALESVNSRLCPPRHTEVPAQRVGTTGCEQDQDRDKVGRRRDPVSHQTVSSELRSRHLGIDTSRNGRKLEHRLSERTAMRVNEGHSDGVGKVPRLVNGIHEQRGSTTGSNGVSLHADVGEKCRTLRLERTRLMTVDFLSEADGKGALGRAAERICWDAWHGTHMPSGVVENGHGSQAPDREERGKGGAAEGIRRLEEEDIDRALAATGKWKSF